MGFRNWNQWQGDIDQQMMESVMDAMVKPRANGVSFASLGYSDVGLDDYWQKCGSYGPKNYT
jgi:hypothetical protein